MKIMTSFVCSVIFMLWIGCKSPSDRIIDEFKKVDSSLQGVNAVIEDKNSLMQLNLSILANQKANPVLALRADSLYLAANAAINFIDSLTKVLLPVDASDESIDMTTKVMCSRNTVTLLHSHLMNVYNYSVKGLVTKTKSASIDSVFYDIKSTSTPLAFLQKLFRNTPSVAAATILAKFKNDCLDVSVITLSDIKGHLTGK